MDTRPFDAMKPDCPSRMVLQRLGDKWTPLVLQALADGPLRFSQVRDAVGGVTPKVLTQTLRSLARDGIVTRTQYPEIPPRVEYELTALGAGLLDPMTALRRWAEAHAGQIRAAQEAFDQLADAGAGL